MLKDQGRSSNVAIVFAIAIACGVFCQPGLAQETIASAPEIGGSPVINVAPPVSIAPPATPTPHRFWDKENRALFAANALLSSADFAVTRSNLQTGGTELNPVARVFGRSTAGLAVNFAGQTVSIVAISYMFHRFGHHKLERLTSIVNLGASGGAVTYDLSHR